MSDAKTKTKKVSSNGSPYTIKVRCTLLTEMLGTLPGDPKIYTEFIQSKCPPDVEDDQLNLDPDIEVEKKTTYFRRTSDGELCLADYMIKGFIKSTGDSIRRRIRKESSSTTSTTGKSGWESWMSHADANIHIFPRYIRLGVKEPDGITERPLRAQTLQGPRVSLARSEMIAADRTFEFEIHVRGGIKREQIIECLDEGKYVGIGQWRNAGFGRIIYEILDETTGNS